MHATAKHAYISLIGAVMTNNEHLRLQTPMKPFAGRLVLLFVAAITILPCQPTTENFRSINIDPKTLVMKFVDRLPLVPPPTRDFYQVFRGNTTSVAHLGPEGSAISYNAFTIDSDGKPLTRTKSQVLSAGPYGTVFAESTYYYGTQYNHQPTDFHVELNFNEGAHEPAQQLASLDHPSELSAVSLVRIFKAAPGYLVACATYDPSGSLTVITVNGSKDGNWVNSNELLPLYPGLDVATIYDDRPRTRRFFGLPETFPISDYLRSPRNMGQKTKLTSYTDIVNFHYRRNRFVRQDVYRPDSSHKTSFLKYAVTAEDLQLEPVDAAIQFGTSAAIKTP